MRTPGMRPVYRGYVEKVRAEEKKIMQEISLRDALRKLERCSKHKTSNARKGR